MCSKACRFRQDFGPPETPSTRIFSGSGIWLRRRRALFSGPLNMGCRPVEGGFSPASIWVPYLLSGVLLASAHVYVTTSVSTSPSPLSPYVSSPFTRPYPPPATFLGAKQPEGHSPHVP